MSFLQIKLLVQLNYTINSPHLQCSIEKSQFFIGTGEDHDIFNFRFSCFQMTGNGTFVYGEFPADLLHVHISAVIHADAGSLFIRQMLPDDSAHDPLGTAPMLFRFYICEERVVVVHEIHQITSAHWGQLLSLSGTC